MPPVPAGPVDVGPLDVVLPLVPVAAPVVVVGGNGPPLDSIHHVPPTVTPARVEVSSGTTRNVVSFVSSVFAGGSGVFSNM